jgi:hypothetical protein
VIGTGDAALGDGDPLAQAPSVTAAARHSKPAMQIGTSSRHPDRRTRDDGNVTDASLRMCFLLFMPRARHRRHDAMDDAVQLAAVFVQRSPTDGD